MNRKIRGVYLITDTGNQDRYSHAELADRAVKAGVRLVQYRDKSKPGREALSEIREIAKLTRKAKTLFIVNDRADFALSGNADGVHLGQEDLPISAARQILGKDKIIGGTSSSPEEALHVEREGADYVALGHIFETTTKKKDYPPVGLETLRKVCESVSIPVVAIGGITLENAPRVLETGADAIAVSSAICRADDPLEAAAKFVDLFR